jgi:hypothetical protein
LLADDNQDVEVRSPEDDHRQKDKATRREEYDREASQPANWPILAADIPMIKLASS